MRLIGKRGMFQDTYAMVDSGADYCLFHASWAAKIGLRLQDGIPDRIDGIAGGLRVYMHVIHIQICGVRVQCDVGFAEKMSRDPENQLIGRCDVFDSMRIGFRQGAGYTYFGPTP